MCCVIGNFHRFGLLLLVFFYRKNNLQELLAWAHPIEKPQDRPERRTLNHVKPDADSRTGRTLNHVDNSASGRKPGGAERTLFHVEEDYKFTAGGG